MKKSKKYTWEDEFVKLPIIRVRSDGKCHIITRTNDKDVIGKGIIAVGDTFEDAEDQFWELLKTTSTHERKRSNELNKWKPFQKGNWSSTGGTWLIVYGIKIYWRYGKNMRYGWYIPFTKMNIMIVNYWTNKNLNS